ncbi:MAG: hypothetical protein PHQ74_15180, partial [Crocinitomicaceae bacterium]|nr:hypothetical protein [Crocinitomicaceae bacterium]
MKNSIKIAFNLCAIALLAFVVTATTGLNPFYSGAGVLASTFLKSGQTGVAYDGLQQEIWTDIIVEQFRTTEDAGFLNEIPDESRWVVSSKGENETIHLNDIGADPEVLINNTSYPIGYSTQTDADIPINLHKFQTKAT